MTRRQSLPRIPRKLLLTLALPLTISACAMDHNAQDYLAAKNLRLHGDTLPHCYNYGCQKTVQITLSEPEWLEIRAVMAPPTENAAAERNKIAAAIALFEQFVGAHAGTNHDKSGTFKGMGARHPQLDCIDESINTTIYLIALQDRGLLLHHTVGAPTTRTPLLSPVGWPHRTAVITDKEMGHLYAVDSWFHDNGTRPEIITLKQWKDGWKPD